ncbi:MAG: RHS repeat-associated core domain-containing protein [Paracoccaceae bacterium]
MRFGGIKASSRPNFDLGSLGQWFQSESGLHQNWMRDYDPTTGRYLQGDPLGLVDGASVYGYALQNPVRYVDPRGEFIPQAVACLVNPWCRAAAGAAAGLLVGYLLDDDNCYSVLEGLEDAATGAFAAWAAGRAAAPIFRPTGPFRPGSWWNSGPNFRLGWGKAPGNNPVFRAAGGSPKAGNHWHYDIYFP